jgi:phosphoglucomutase
MANREYDPSNVSPMAGKLPTPALLVDAPKLVTAYFAEIPDLCEKGQRAAFGTSGYRGSSFDASFNQWHVLAVSQAIFDYRKLRGIGGPLFLGIDKHALSVSAWVTGLEVLAANGAEVILADGDEYTPTPAISHAILGYNRGRRAKFADGIVITPLRNPSDNGDFKYNPPNGGPADQDVTDWIAARANGFLESGVPAEGISQLTPHSSTNCIVREAADKDRIGVDIANWRHALNQKSSAVQFGNVSCVTGDQLHAFEL